MTTGTRVAFVQRPPVSGFMRMDQRCLESAFDVEELHYGGHQSPGYLWRSWRAVGRADAVYVVFGSEHGLIPALVAKLRRRRFVLVPAGYDYANKPERRYGLAARGRGWLPKLLGRMCDVALPVSKQCMWEFLALVPSAAPRTHLAYHALDPEEWPNPGVARDQDVVVTVAYVDEEAWWRKGIERFVAAAEQDPGRRYLLAGQVVGSVLDRIRAMRLPNLDLVLDVDRAELCRVLWSAGVYVQLSWHETFGLSMAEAMLCGCVPVRSESPALQEVGGAWAISPAPDESDAAAIGRAVQRGRSVDRAAIRHDIATRFSPERRAAILERAVRGEL